jgi:hypothetical protein
MSSAVMLYWKRGAAAAAMGEDYYGGKLIAKLSKHVMA